MKYIIKTGMIFFLMIMISSMPGIAEEYCKKASITRDDKGVWYIKACNTYQAYEAMGYCSAEDRLWQAELFRRNSQGKLAEIFGDFPGVVETDLYMRTIGYSQEELEQYFTSLDKVSKTIIRAYVDGFNRRIAEVREDPSKLPFEFVVLGYTPEDWKVTDVLSWLVCLQRMFDSEALATGQIDNASLLQGLQAKFGVMDGFGMFEDLRWLNDPDAPTMIPNRETGKKQYRYFNKKSPYGRHNFQKAAQKINERKKNREKVLKKINICVNKMASYAWVVSGRKTASGNPILYSGPEMGFSAPAIVSEGSIETPDFKVSGVIFAGLPGMAIGRTPYFTWSMQVGQAHTVDYYLEDPSQVSLHRIETVKVAGGEDILLPIYRTSHGPVIYPLPYDPGNPGDIILSWKYSHRGLQEFSAVRSLFEMAEAKNIKSFTKAVERIPMSMHFCFAHRSGAIGYIMSGKDPVRPEGVETRLPLLGDGSQEWLPNQYKPRSFDLNPKQGFYGGWNNKSNPDYDTNNALDIFQYGVFHRAHVIQDYLKAHKKSTFEELRDLALNIATTDSMGEGGNIWKYTAPYFKKAVMNDPSAERLEALSLLENWDGHFIAGGSSQWAFGTMRDDAWVLITQWVGKVLEMTFEDELLFMDPATQEVVKTWENEHRYILFNVFLHALAGESSGVVNQNDWFQDTSGSGKPTTGEGIIVAALDTVLAELGGRPWNVPRGEITYPHDLLGNLWTTPFSWRSTYGQVVEMGPRGPEKIQSMFPLGQSGNILFGGLDPQGNPIPFFDKNYFSMIEVYDWFAHRDFPLFK